MPAEIWQFLGAAAVFCIAALLWLRLIYLPRRTMERQDRREDEEGPGGN